MIKRILSIVIAMLILVPFALSLVACEKERTEEEIINDIVNSGTVALTLSVWIPTNANADSAEFAERLSSVEDAINKILRDKNYSTKLDLVAVSTEEYEEKLDAHIAEIKQKVDAKNGLLPSNISQGYVNQAEKIIYGDSYIYELAYPKVLDTQLDLFLIRNYKDYVKYAQSQNNKGELDSQIYDLKNYVDKLGGKYADIHRMIVPEIINQYMLGNSIFAIPNNHLYVEDAYQYILINKNALSTQEDVKIESITDIISCKDFINKIGENPSSGFVPFVGSLDDAPNFIEFDSSSLIGGSYNKSEPSSIFDLDDYTAYVQLYKDLVDSGYVKESLGEGEKAAVSFFYGSSTEAKEYEDEYYLIKSEMPVAKEECFSSMFAISKYSANYDRAMSILYLLLTDSDIITLLQYGIEGEDYTIELDENDQEYIVVNEESAYDMTGLNLGNSYHTYPSNGSSLGDWDYEKEINYDLVADPYMNIENNFNDNATDEEKASLEALRTAVSSYADSVKNLVDAMNGEEYGEFIKLYNLDIEKVTAEISELEENIEKETSATKLNEMQEKLNELKSLKSDYESNEAISIILGTKDYKNLVALYKEIYSKYN